MMSPPDRFVAPSDGWRAGLANRAANSVLWRRLRRRLSSIFPAPIVLSDVRDVVYANWLVPADAVRHLVPPRVTISCRDGLTLFTILTYRHGHFGPRAAGPLRRLFPSPLQSNWRLYVESVDGVPTPEPTVLFIRNVFNSAVYALGSRMMSDALPSHLARQFEMSRNGEIMIDGGRGSAPSISLITTPTKDTRVPPDFVDWFGKKRDPLMATCLQDVAIVPAERALLAQAWIYLPIDIATIEPLAATFYGPGAFLGGIGATALPSCFRVPAVPFTVLRERIT